MNDSTVTTVATNLPVTPITVRDSQYLTYGNIASCTGHRLVYHNDSVADTNLSNYSSQPTEQDYIAIVITGAATSTQVLQITITY